MEKQHTRNPSSDSSPSPAELHRTDADVEDDSVKQLGECSSLYLSLQDCLVNTNRNWKQCQKEVQALKACSDHKRMKQ
ncbi:hypothetical protein M569_06923, partial [Genlisea aurea]